MYTLHVTFLIYTLLSPGSRLSKPRSSKRRRRGPLADPAPGCGYQWARGFNQSWAVNKGCQHAGQMEKTQPVDECVEDIKVGYLDIFRDYGPWRHS